MPVSRKTGVTVTRRCRKNGRRFVEMVCEVGSFTVAAEMARQFNKRDDDHIYVFSWRTTARKAEGFWSDRSEDFDVAAFFRKMDGVKEPAKLDYC